MTQIAFALKNTHIRCEIVTGTHLHSKREEWRLMLNGTVVCYCATEGQAERVKREIDLLAERILSGALDEAPETGSEER